MEEARRPWGAVWMALRCGQGSGSGSGSSGDGEGDELDGLGAAYLSLCSAVAEGALTAALERADRRPGRAAPMPSLGQRVPAAERPPGALQYGPVAVVLSASS